MMPQDPLIPIRQSHKAKAVATGVPDTRPNSQRPVAPDVCTTDRGGLYVRFLGTGLRPRRVGPFPDQETARRFQDELTSHVWDAITDAALSFLQKGR